MRPWTWLALIVIYSSAWAETLPYASRSQSYAGFGHTLRGDIKTIGMAGAVTGLGDSLIGALENPAGLAMTLPSTTLSATRNRVFDGQLQDFNSSMDSNIFVIGGPAYPWGFSLATWTPNFEGSNYTLNDGSQDVNATVKTKDLRLSVARVLLKDRLSIGIGLGLGSSIRSVTPTSNPSGVESFSSSKVSFNTGVLVQLPHRVLLGLTYHFPLSFSGDGNSANSTLIPGYFQTTESPGRLGIGIGYIPNRFFKTGLSFIFGGKTSAASAIRNESLGLNRDRSFQVRLGGSYKAIEFRNFKTTVGLGFYYEKTQIQTQPSRIHLTGGLDVNAWILNLGFAVDAARQYKNYSTTLSLNIVKTFRLMGVLPKEKQGYYVGWFPRVFRRHEWGLPRSLVRNRHNRGRGTDLFKMGRDIKKNLEKGLEEVEDFVGGEEDAEKRKSHRRRKTWKDTQGSAGKNKYYRTPRKKLKKKKKKNRKKYRRTKSKKKTQ